MESTCTTLCATESSASSINKFSVSKPTFDHCRSFVEIISQSVTGWNYQATGFINETLVSACLTRSDNRHPFREVASIRERWGYHNHAFLVDVANLASRSPGQQSLWK